MLARSQVLPPKTLLAVCATQQVATVLEQAASHHQMQKVRANIVVGDRSAADRLLRQAPMPPDIFVFEPAPETSPEDIMAALQVLAPHVSPRTIVYVIGHANDVPLFRTLMDAGVEDYMVAPVDPLVFVAAVERSVAERAGDVGTGRSVMVLGASGGAGATTVASNIGFLLARHHKRTAIVDLAAPLGGIATSFDANPVAEARILYTPDRIADVDVLRRISVTAGPDLSLICAPAEADRLFRPLGTGEEGVNALWHLARDVFEVTVFDIPIARLRSAELVSDADAVVLVVSPDFVGVKNAQVVIRQLLNLKPTRPPIVVINRRGASPEEWSDEELEQALNTSVKDLISIRSDGRFFHWAGEGRVICDGEPGHASVRSFRQILGRLEFVSETMPTADTRSDGSGAAFAGLARKVLGRIPLGRLGRSR